MIMSGLVPLDLYDLLGRLGLTISVILCIKIGRRIVGYIDDYVRFGVF